MIWNRKTHYRVSPERDGLSLRYTKYINIIERLF